MKTLLISLTLSLAAAGVAQADAVDALRDFARDVKSGKANFTQTVTAPDGKRKKVSSGSFEFERPNRFRFVYAKPFEQTIVADGSKVWIYDADLNQASSRKLADALGATPAAVLAGQNLERDFALKALASDGGLDWVQASPKAAESTIQSLKLGFKGATSPRWRSSTVSASARGWTSAPSRPMWPCRPTASSSSCRPAPT